MIGFLKKYWKKIAVGLIALDVLVWGIGPVIAGVWYLFSGK